MKLKRELARLRLTKLHNKRVQPTPPEIENVETFESVRWLNILIIVYSAFGVAFGGMLFVAAITNKISVATLLLALSAGIICCYCCAGTGNAIRQVKISLNTSSKFRSEFQIAGLVLLLIFLYFGIFKDLIGIVATFVLHASTGR